MRKKKVSAIKELEGSKEHSGEGGWVLRRERYFHAFIHRILLRKKKMNIKKQKKKKRNAKKKKKRPKNLRKIQKQRQ